MTNPRHTYRLVGLNEIAKMLSLSPDTIRRLISRGEFPPSATIGQGARRWRHRDIVDWCDAHDPR